MERYYLHILLTWVVILYIPSFYCDFVLDDAFLIVRNRYFENGNIDWWSILSSDLWSGEEVPDGVSSFYRPIFLLTIAVDILTFGFDPFWFHIHNLLWHLLCVIVFWKFILQLKLNREQAILACSFFALHPINSEVVVWISSRNDSIATFFAFCTLLFAFKSRILVFIFSLGAYFSKESTLLLPFWIFICLMGNKHQRSSALSSLLALIPWFFVRSTLNIPTQIPDDSHIQLFFGTLPTTLAHITGSIIAPIELSAVRPLAWYDLNIFMGFGSVVLALIYIVSKDRKYFWLGVLSYVPVLLPIALNGIYGDRYLYIPLLWFSIWLSRSFEFQRYKWIYIMMFLGFSYRVSLRIPEWKNDLFMWNAEVLHTESSYAKASLAHILYNEGHYETSLNYYKDAFDDDVPYLDGCTIYLSLILKNRSPQLVISEYEWLREVGCEREGTLDGILLLALVATERYESAEHLLQTMDIDRSKRSDIGRSVLAIRNGDWSVACEAQKNWDNPDLFSKQLQVMLGVVNYQGKETPIENDILFIKCRN
jgi:protein O-mannosyl-transferase